MTAKAKAKTVAFTTSKGTAMYPWLNRADYQYDKAGKFKVQLRVSNDDAKPLMEAIKLAAEEAFGKEDAKSARMPFKKDAETGEIIFSTASKFKPKIVDSTGAIIQEVNEPAIYGGSTLKLAGTMYPYNAGGGQGVSLQLAGVQIIELSEGSGAASVSFGAEEGGFVASNDNDTGDHNF